MAGMEAVADPTWVGTTIVIRYGKVWKEYFSGRIYLFVSLVVQIQQTSWATSLASPTLYQIFMQEKVVIG